MSPATAAGAPIRIGALSIQFLLEPEASAGSVSMFRCDLRAGARVPAPHSHDAYDETVYGLEGTLRWTIAGTPTEVGPGQVLHIARGAVHHFDNPGSVDARALAIVTPGILGPSYFEEAAAVLAAAAGGPPDLAAIADVMRRHGLTPVPDAGS